MKKLFLSVIAALAFASAALGQTIISGGGGVGTLPSPAATPATVVTLETGTIASEFGYDADPRTPVAIDPTTGFAWFVYEYNPDGVTTDYIRLARCNDAACSAPTFTNVQSAAGGNGTIGLPTLAISPAGLARIAYRNTATSKIRYIQCTNAACSTKTDNDITVGGTTYGANYGVALGYDPATDLGTIVYEDSMADKMNVVHCSNVACSATTTNQRTGQGETISVKIGSDHFARYVYNDADTSFMTLVICSTLNCSASSVVQVAASDYYVDLVLDSSNVPYLFYSVSSEVVEFTKCSNAACASTSTPVDFTFNVVPGLADVSIFLGNDGFPRLYIGKQNPNAVAYIRCKSATCASNDGVVLVTAISDGSYIYSTAMAKGLDGFGRIMGVAGFASPTPKVFYVRLPNDAGYVGVNLGSPADRFSTVYALNGDFLNSLTVEGSLVVTSGITVNPVIIGPGACPNCLATDNTKFNVAAGSNALANLTTGQENTAIGVNAGAGVTTQSDTVYVGRNAGITASGDGNVGIGNNALSVATGASNVALGSNAGAGITTGQSNLAIGEQSLFTAGVTGDANEAIGYRTLFSLTSGTHNLAMGNVAGKFITTGSENVVFGNSAGASITTGAGNLAIGTGVMWNGASGVITGSDNVGIGAAVLSALTSGGNNVGIGDTTLGAVTTGSDNIAIGHTAGSGITTGSKNITIGYQATVANGTSQLNIGDLITGVMASGSKTILIDALKTTGAASGKKVVCVDTATGQLYASSTGVDCSN